MCWVWRRPCQKFRQARRRSNQRAWPRAQHPLAPSPVTGFRGEEHRRPRPQSNGRRPCKSRPSKSCVACGPSQPGFESLLKAWAHLYIWNGMVDLNLGPWATGRGRTEPFGFFPLQPAWRPPANPNAGKNCGYAGRALAGSALHAVSHVWGRRRVRCRTSGCDFGRCCIYPPSAARTPGQRGSYRRFQGRNSRNCRGGTGRNLLRVAAVAPCSLGQSPLGAVFPSRDFTPTLGPWIRECLFVP